MATPDGNLLAAAFLDPRIEGRQPRGAPKYWDGPNQQPLRCRGSRENSDAETWWTEVVQLRRAVPVAGLVPVLAGPMSGPLV